VQVQTTTWPVQVQTTTWPGLFIHALTPVAIANSFSFPLRILFPVCRWKLVQLFIFLRMEISTISN
jgi:hypothetical protein